MPRPLRLGLDGAALTFPYPPGVARVARELLPRLEAAGHVPLVPAADERERRWRHRELPRLERELDLDGILSLTSAFPVLGRGLRIQTIHELPWRHGVPENAGRTHRLWARHGRRRADLVLVPSERVLADLADFAPAAAAKARVLAWGVDEPFTAAPSEALAADDVARLTALGVEPDPPFVLVPGGARPKKRVDLVVQGIAPLRGAGGEGADAPRILVTGAVDLASGGLDEALRLARTLGIEDRLKYLGPVADEDLAALYRAALAVCVLSDSEGFGLGALEGLACGAPVLVPAGSAQAEVLGSPSLPMPRRLPPGDPEALHGALVELLAARGSAAEAERRARRRREAGTRTWDRTALDLQGHLDSLPR